MKRFDSNGFRALAISLLGGEVTAFMFAAALDPATGFRALFLPAVFPTVAIGGLVGGLIAWPIVRIAQSEAAPFAFGSILFVVTSTATYFLVRFDLIDAFFVPIISFALGICISVAFTHSRFFRLPATDPPPRPK